MSEAAPVGRSAIVLVLDRLQAAMLGPYGNTWIRTPGWNALAAQSFVFDQAFASSPDLRQLYEAYWAPHANAANDEYLPARAAKRNLRTALLTDDPALKEFAGADRFDEAILLDLAKQQGDDGEAATFFASAAEQARQLCGRDEPFLLWLHTGTLGRAWDAPREYRDQYTDQEDPPAPDLVTPPEQRLPEDFDPDELLGLVHAYAGQVTLLDGYLSALLEELDACKSASVALHVVGARGYPLGEHRRLGPCDHALFSELVHVPWFVRAPEQGGPGRSAALVHSADLHATLADWLLDEREATPSQTLAAVQGGQSVHPILRGEATAIRDRLAILQPHERVLRTPAWLLRQTYRQNEPGQTQLYSKPDDLFEVNEVASRAPQIVAELEQSLAELASPRDAAKPLSPLSEIALEGLE